MDNGAPPPDFGVFNGRQTEGDKENIGKRCGAIVRRKKKDILQHIPVKRNGIHVNITANLSAFGQMRVNCMFYIKRGVRMAHFKEKFVETINTHPEELIYCYGRRIIHDDDTVESLGMKHLDPIVIYRRKKRARLKRRDGQVATFDSEQVEWENICLSNPTHIFHWDRKKCDRSRPGRSSKYKLNRLKTMELLNRLLRPREHLPDDNSNSSSETNAKAREYVICNFLTGPNSILKPRRR